MRIRLLVLFWVVAALGITATAEAASPRQGITLSPPIQKFELNPGTVYSGSFSVSDPGDTEYDLSLSASPYSVRGETYEQLFTSRPDLVDASKWFSFPSSKYHLKPGQTTQVQFTVRAPQDIAGGGYYAAVFAQAAPPTGSNGIVAQKRVAMLSYITVSGNIKNGGSIASFQAPLIQTEPPLHSDLRMENTGNVHYDAQLSWEVKDLFGNVKYLQATDYIVLPKTIRKIGLDWKASPEFGLFNSTGTVKYLGKTEKMPARWTLMLSANAFLIIAGVLVAMGLFAFLTRRSRGKVRRG